MAGDQTRFTFKPGKDYSSVWKQQGRVDLDADWNEYAEIADRRWRSETMDIIGRCTVPRITEKAFFITPAGGGNFLIGRGRMYVDGLQAENHGLPPLAFGAALAEEAGTVDVPYSNQPYLPTGLPPVLPGTPGTTDLIYIDVWQREVTYLEDPSIQEIALGGPDTAMRIQTVWQVRALMGVGPHKCDDRLEQWDAVAAPSGARLTTSAVAPPASDDPCIISPAGGYRGLENRLYRVEIHAIGGVGGATPAKFKWSRDNGSVATTVDGIDGTSTQLTVRRIGRDQVLRFQVGDWLEVLDDHTEFRQISGHTARVTAVDEANRTLTISPAIPASFAFNATDPGRHTRVRRWDQQIGVDANGLLDVVAGPVELEDGVRVSFSGSNYKVGDFWVFAARTADGSVEPLISAPPRGIHHHFCRLGFLTWTVGGGTFLDCRNLWPPPFGGGGGNEIVCDCCTVTVGDGVNSIGDFTDIQTAINSLGPAGGLVCILRGVFQVRTTIFLRSLRNIIIRGMGPSTRIVFLGEGDIDRPVFEVLNCESIWFEDLWIGANRAASGIRFQTSHLCTVDRCTIINFARSEIGAPVQTGRAIDFVEEVALIEIRRCFLLAMKGVASTQETVRKILVADTTFLTRNGGIFLPSSADLTISRCRLLGLSPEEMAKLAGVGPLTAANVDAFQSAAASLFLTGGTTTAFQAAVITLITCTRLNVDHSLIFGQAGIVLFLGIEVNIADNDIFSLVSFVLWHGIAVKFDRNAVFGLVAGVVQAGIMGDFCCMENLFLGQIGIGLLSTQEFQKIIAPFFGSVLGSAGFSTIPGSVIGSLTTSATGAAGSTNNFGFVLVAKIHANSFLTFTTGISKTAAVISSDVSIIDNSFTLCRSAAVDLNGIGSGAAPPTLSTLATPRHLIQSNSMAVRGFGVRSRVAYTSVVENHIVTANIGIDIAAPRSSVANNRLEGPVRSVRADVAMIRAGEGASELRITGNSIRAVPGYGILIASNVREVRIEDNEILGCQLNAISTASKEVALSIASICRNRILRCQIGSDTIRAWFNGGIVVSGGEGVRIVDNTLFRIDSEITKTTVTDFLAAVYVEDADNTEISGNQVDECFASRAAGSILVGIACLRNTGKTKARGNNIRQPNGFAFDIGKSEEALVTSNAFEGNGSFDALVQIMTADVIQFNDNRAAQTRGNQQTFGALAGLRSVRIVANSNIIEAFGFRALSADCREVVINGNHCIGREPAISVVNAGRGVISSNVVITGVIAPPPVIQALNV